MGVSNLRSGKTPLHDGSAASGVDGKSIMWLEGTPVGWNDPWHRGWARDPEGHRCEKTVIKALFPPPTKGTHSNGRTCRRTRGALSRAAGEHEPSMGRVEAMETGLWRTTTPEYIVGFSPGNWFAVDAMVGGVTPIIWPLTSCRLRQQGQAAHCVCELHVPGQQLGQNEGRGAGAPMVSRTEQEGWGGSVQMDARCKGRWAGDEQAYAVKWGRTSLLNRHLLGLGSGTQHLTREHVNARGCSCCGQMGGGRGLHTLHKAQLASDRRLFVQQRSDRPNQVADSSAPPRRFG